MSAPVPAVASLRAPLLLASIALGANAALLVVQTLVFQLVAWDSSAIGTVSSLLRALFLLADVVLVVAFVTLARARTERAPLGGLAWNGAALATYAACAGLLGLLGHMLGEDVAAVHVIAAKLAAPEPVLSLGASLLMALALRALGTHRTTALVVAVAGSIAVTLAFRFLWMVAPSPRSVSAVWVSWLVAVARPAILALWALRLARALGPASGANEAGAGPYRGPGDGPLPAPRAEVPDPATVTMLHAGARALVLYRAAFLARVGSSALTTLVIVVASFNSGDGLAVLLLAPVVSLVTALLIALSLAKVRALPRASGARSLTLGAMVFAALAALTDAAVVLYAANLSADHYSTYAVRRHVAEVVWPGGLMVTLLMGVSLLLVAGAIGRVGDALDAPTLPKRARWVQGLAVGTGASILGLLFIGAPVFAERFDHGGSEAGALVVAVHLLVAVPSVIAVLVLHAVLVGAGRRALVAYADRRAG